MDFFNTMDPETAALIIQLLIEEASDMFDASAGKGKGWEGELSDTQVALLLHKEDLERTASLIADRQMTNSIARACESDGNVLSAAFSEEQAAASDRGTAHRIAGVHPPNLIEWKDPSEALDNEVLEKLAALYVSAPVEGPATESALVKYRFPAGSGNNDDEAESSAWAATRPTPDEFRRQCTACQENVLFCELARAPCNHEYCRECLRELFRASLTDDSLFPPRCCRQPITAGGGVSLFLTGSLLSRYLAKKIEFDTPNRTYCSNPSCSIFIRLEDITGEQAVCSSCGTVTCTLCKAGQHNGDCPADTGLQQVLETARENNWQRCYNCRRLVELDIGCNHITFVLASSYIITIVLTFYRCTCNVQFCYICGREWKTCACAQWHEDRLLARAEQVVARQPVRADAPLQQARIAAAIQNLRDRHNCNHESWRYVGGRHQCEECRYMLPSYIFECQQCSLRACNRCRRNRL
jgi:hypothetical protein